MNKYHNRKVITSDGIEHDSQREAKRWCELLLLQRAGKIQDLQRQVKFVLIPAQYEVYERYSKKGERLKDGQKCIEKEYIIKRKLMLYIHHIRIKEV